MFDAGLTFFCLDPGETPAAMLAFINSGDGYMLQVLRQMTKHNVYIMAHSVSTNGISSNSVIVTIVPWWQTALLVMNGVFALGFAVFTVLTVVGVCSKKNKKAERRN